MRLDQSGSSESRGHGPSRERYSPAGFRAAKTVCLIFPMGKQRDQQAKSRGAQTSYFLLPDQLLDHEIHSLKRMAKVPWPTPLSSWQRLLFTAANHAQNRRQLELHLTFEARDCQRALKTSQGWADENQPL